MEAGYLAGMDYLNRSAQQRAQTDALEFDTAQRKKRQTDLEAVGGWLPGALAALASNGDAFQQIVNEVRAATPDEGQGTSPTPTPVGEISYPSATGPVITSPYVPTSPPQPGAAPPAGPPMGGMGAIPPSSPPVSAGPPSLPAGASPASPVGAAPPAPVMRGQPAQIAPPPGWMPPPQGMGSPGVDQATAAIDAIQPPTLKPPTMPKELLSVPKLMQELNKANLTPTQKLMALEMAMPYIEKQNKQELAEAKIELQAQKATQEYAAKVAQIAEKAKERVRREGAQQETTRHNLATEGIARDRLAQRGMSSKIAQPSTGAGKPSPEQDDALRVQAWTYIMKGTLPYRKGSGGGADRNDQVMRMVAEIARENGMTPEQVVAMPASWKADAQSMAFQTKKLDAIEGTLSSFHNNIDTWNAIAQGTAPALGGERVAAFAKDMEKINFTGVKSFDDVKLKIQQEFNDPTVAAYMVSAMAVAMDFARIMQGPQSVASLTEGSRKDAQRLIAAGMNDKARAGVLAALESDAQGQVKGIKDQLDTIRRRMGIRGSRADTGGSADSSDALAREARDAIARGAPAAAVRERYKKQTGKDLP